MENNVLVKIIENYNEQCKLYQEMLSLSQEQNKLLNADSEDCINDIHLLIQKRKNLMDEITRLNENNKKMQQELTTQLNINEFMFTKLEGLIDEEYYNKLKLVVSCISNVLGEINDNDKMNEALIKQQMKQKKNRQKNVADTKVSSAYKEAMKSSQPKKSEVEK